MRDPLEYCIKCDSRYSITDEECHHCGFCPIDGRPDEEEQEQALKEYRDANT